MKILWLTNTPSNASQEFGHNSFGGGWISSLETLLTERSDHRLGVCFFYNGVLFKKLKKGNVDYFGVPIKKGNAISRVLMRHFARLEDDESAYFNEVMDEFKPDLIHVFGTESGYGKILMNRSEKVLFNIQGLLVPISNNYFPLGFSRIKILSWCNFNSILRGITPLHDFRIFKKKAIREDTIIKFWKYFIGRTDWDRNYIHLINPKAKYFHCEEMLRSEFFSNEWSQPSELTKDNLIVIGTTISPNLYKGLDLIYKVLEVMEGYKICWKIFGVDEEDFINQISLRVATNGKKNTNIHFYGMLNASELINQLKTCHFFVHPSYIDNSPNSVCEAMMLGMPVLSSSVGGIKTLVKNEETGILFNPYDSYDLAGLLVHLFNNFEKAKQMGLNARQVAMKRHSPQAIISQLNSIYDCIYKDMTEK
jgi:glycosyltransferase involved in cell wall biosynthesis